MELLSTEVKYPAGLPFYSNQTIWSASDAVASKENDTFLFQIDIDQCDSKEKARLLNPPPVREIKQRTTPQNKNEEQLSTQINNYFNERKTTQVFKSKILNNSELQIASQQATNSSSLGVQVPSLANVPNDQVHVQLQPKNNFELVISAQMYKQLLSANELFNQTEQINDKKKSILQNANFLNNIFAKPDSKSQEKESFLVDLYSNYLESYTVVLKNSRIDPVSAKKGIGHLDELMNSLSNQLEQHQSSRLINSGPKWSQIISEIVLQKEINKQLQLQNKRLENSVSKFTSEKSSLSDMTTCELNMNSTPKAKTQRETEFFGEIGLNKKIADFKENNAILEKNIVELEKEKTTNQQKIDDFDKWKVNVNSEFSQTVENIESMIDFKLAFERIYEITIFSELENKIEPEKMNKIEEFKKEKMENSTKHKIDSDRNVEVLNKMINVLTAKRKEVDFLENELKILEIEENDMRDLEKVLLNLSFKFQQVDAKMF